MIRIEIETTTVDEFKGESKSTGKPFHIRKQPAYAHLPGKPYPVEVGIRLKPEQPPYAKGNYTLSPDSFWVDRFGGLKLSPRLVPVKAQAAA